MPTTSQKPRVFIGSSGEARDSLGLRDYFALPASSGGMGDQFDSIEICPWYDQRWLNFESVLKSLEEFLSAFNYGIFIFWPDDKIDYRGNSKIQTRDNVVFELGLFYATLGTSRTYILTPNFKDGSFRILTDVGSEVMQGKFDCEKIPSSTGGKDEYRPIGDSFKTAFTEAMNQIQKHYDSRVSRATSEVTLSNKFNEQANKFWAAISESAEHKNRIAHSLHIVRKWIPNLTIWRSIIKGRTIAEEMQDIILYYKNVEDILDINELAKKQSKSSSALLSEVWVFSEVPIEFVDSSIVGNAKIKSLTETVKRNLLSGVKYKYFISTASIEKLGVKRRIKSRFGSLPDDVKRNIEFILLDETCFQTFYTVHKIDEDDDVKNEVFMSFITKDREKDYFLRASPDQSSRVENILHELSKSGQAYDWRSAV